MGSIEEISNSNVVETTTPIPVSPSELPVSSSQSISLVVATLLERVQCWHINAHSWRGPLSIPQYVSREAFLERQLLTGDGKITYWILTDTSLSPGRDGARPILASCETLQKAGYLASDSNIKRLLAHGIGSVFCRHEYRGRGYASRMMRELGKTLETWQQLKGTKSTFSMLWSDIGRSFYAAHGWEPMSSTHISIPPMSKHISNQPHNQLECSRIRDLSAHDLRDRICPKAIAILEAQLQARSNQTPAVRYIAIRPDYDHMEWHHVRERFQAKALYDKDPNIKGAEDPVTGCAMIWSRVWGETTQNNKLHILYTIIPTEAPGNVTGSITALLLRAQIEASTWEMHGGVELWSPAASVLEAAQFLAGEEKVQIAVRDKESVCSLRWIDGERQKVEWLANEKYAWC